MVIGPVSSGLDSRSSPEITTPVLELLQDRMKPGSLLVRPERSGYYPGEILEVELFNLDGSSLGFEGFLIQESPGSGFAGQVYQALPAGWISLEGRPEREPHPVAIKILKPKARGKRFFRDALFGLCYQVSYAPRLREEPLRCGLIWQALLRIAAGIEFGSCTAIARPLGYFWDADTGSYAEIHEWIESRSTRYSADDRMLLRMFRRDLPPPASEMGRKRQFMEDLVQLCHEIGAPGLARQYEWYTGVSQANVLARRRPGAGETEFVAVDCRPGLAVPFFLPLSPVHARIIWKGLHEGNLTHFDEVDFERLDAYVAGHPDAFEAVFSLIHRLKEDDERYRAGLPAIWQASGKGWSDREHWTVVKSSLIADWFRLGRISKLAAGRLRSCRLKFLIFFLLKCIPVIGPVCLRLLGDERYRRHLYRLFVDPAYFREALEVKKAADLLDWIHSGRISPERAARLADKTFSYFLEKVFLSWQPANWQLLFTDQVARKQLLEGWFFQPFRLFFFKDYRESWLLAILHEQQERGLVEAAQVTRLEQQVREGRMQGFIKDLGFTAGLEGLSKTFTIGLAAYGLYTGDFLPFGLAALGPIPPSGVARGIYTLIQLFQSLPHILKQRDRRLLLARAFGIALAPWRAIGNLFVPLEIFTYYNEISLLVANYFISKMVTRIPVLGGQGKLLEYAAFLVFYNLPLSIKRAIIERSKE